MWDRKFIKHLEEAREKSISAGGQKRLEMQHTAGKLSARERLAILFDTDSFMELYSLVESRSSDFGMATKRIPGDGVIVGYGKINGRLVVASSEDFTVIGGTLGEYHSLKICQAMDMALDMKVPYISINDSGGARIEEGIDSLSGYSGIFLRNTRASGVIPQIAVIMGPCAGGACYSPAICDFVFMTDKTSRMFITGPQVVKAVTSEDISAEELGGADVQTSTSGVAHFKYLNDEDCLTAVRKLLGYLPQNNQSCLPVVAGRSIDESPSIEDIIPCNSKKAYDVHSVIQTIIDKDSFYEVQFSFAANIVVGFSRIDGRTVGIVANQPSVKAGALDSDASDKAARFIRFCDCFNIPILTLVDVPGYMPGKLQEHSGIIRHGAKLLYAYSEATVPKVTLILRKAFGGAYIAMNSKKMGADLVYALPIAQIAVMGAEGAVDIIHRKEIGEADNQLTARAAFIDRYEEMFMNPAIAAARGYVDEVLKPFEVRRRIADAFELLRTKDKSNPWKKHGNIPL